ncbi:MAG: hypothetical protein NXI31_06895 [bacterium]|nr:hypothetical protein [bacterium]
MNVLLDTCLRYAVMFVGIGLGAVIFAVAVGDQSKSGTEINGRFIICVGLLFVGLALLPTIGPYLAACIPDGIREWMGPRTSWRTIDPWQERIFRILVAIAGTMLIQDGIRMHEAEQAEPRQPRESNPK